MIRRDSPKVSVARQCCLLGVNRSSLYQVPSGPADPRLPLMNAIDRIYLEHPFMGSRQMTRALRAEGFLVHRSRVQRLMQVMDLHSMAPGPHTSRKHPSHPTYPYLLRDLEVNQPNQVWATDITYIPFRKGFFYLIAIQDWYSRKILSWRLSPTLDLAFCLEALHEALAAHGTPQIFNTDQGSHFTASAWVNVLRAHGVAISMDGKGRALDNVFVERFWRSLKYEIGIGWWITPPAPPQNRTCPVRHPAPQVMDSLRSGTPSERPAEAVTDAADAAYGTVPTSASAAATGAAATHTTSDTPGGGSC